MTTKITNIAGIGSTTAAILSEYKFDTVASIAHATVEALSAVPGFSVARAEKTIHAANKLLGSTASGSDIGAADSPGEADTQTESKKDKKKKDKSKDKKKNKKAKKNKKDKKKSAKNKSKDKKKNKKRK